MKDIYQSKLTPQYKRISLVNTPTLLTLTFITLGLLWLLQPSKAVLIDMVDDSRSPEVAIAFLEAIQNNSAPSLQLRLALAKQHNQADNYQESLNTLTPISDFTDSKHNDAAISLYAENLLKLTQWFKDDKQYERQLIEFLTAQVGSVTTTEAKERSQNFSNYALQLGQAKLALALLKPLENTAEVSEHTLLNLALQAGEAKDAIQSAQRIYTQNPNGENFITLLRLYQQNSEWQQGIQLIKLFFTRPNINTALYQPAIDFARAAQQPKLAFKLAHELATKNGKMTTWLQASELSASMNDLSGAVFWLEKVVSKQPSLPHLKKLHQYYRWLGETLKALEISKQLSHINPTPTILRSGISEASAVSDLFALSDFYFLLIKQNQLDEDEILAWLDLNDKAYGASSTTKRLNILTKENSNSTQIWHSLSRFYEYQGNTQGIVSIWPKVKPFSPFNYDIAYRYAKAFIKTNQLEQALAILRDHAIRESFNLEALAATEQLAWYINDTKTVKELQKIRLKNKDVELDPYRFATMRKAMTEQDIKELLALYQLNKHPDSIIVVLEHAIALQDITLLNTALELIYKFATEPLDKSLMLITARANIVKQNWPQAIRTLKALLAQHPDYQAAETEAFWLALSRNKLDWLNHLYLNALPKAKSNPRYYQVLAYSAIALSYPQQALHWFSLLQQDSELSVSDKLTLANLFESQGMNSSATQLRYQVFSQLEEKLKKLPDGEITYRSLVSLFSSPALAKALAILDANKKITTAKLDEVARFYFSQNGLDKLQFYITSALLNDQKTSESLQLVLANAQNDQQTLHRLIRQETKLSNFEKAIALEKLGHTKLSWQYAENALNQTSNHTDIQAIKHFLVSLHPQRTHALRATYHFFDSWHANRSELAYYLPVGDNQWQVFTQVDKTSSNNKLLPDYQAKQLVIQTNRLFNNSPWNAGVTLHERFGETKLGGFASWQYHTHHFHGTLKLEKNKQTTQSEALWLMGDEDRIELQGSLQLTRRENISLSLNKSQFHSHFDDKIGSQIGGMLRFDEKLFFEPRWQVYIQYDHQKNTLESKPFVTLNTELVNKQGLLNRPLLGSDFLSPEFKRISIGQRIAHGEVGQPGAIATAPRYWLDTTFGYNLLAKRNELSANAGIGMPIAGNDELFLTGTWQSANSNNQKNLTLTLGYYFKF